MRFRDLFLPTLAQSNPNARKKAVMKENDKGVLIRVIQNDSNRDARQAARKRLQRLNAWYDPPPWLYRCAFALRTAYEFSITNHPGIQISRYYRRLGCPVHAL